MSVSTFVSNEWTNFFLSFHEKKGAEETYQLDRKTHLKQNSQDLQLSIAEEGQSLDSQLTQQIDRIALNPPPLCIFIMKEKWRQCVII